MLFGPVILATRETGLPPHCQSGIQYICGLECGTGEHMPGLIAGSGYRCADWLSGSRCGAGRSGGELLLAVTSVGRVAFYFASLQTLQAKHLSVKRVHVAENNSRNHLEHCKTELEINIKKKQN